MKNLKSFEKLFEDAGKHKFGCSMVFFDLPLMEALHKIVDEDDIYTEEDSEREFGLETAPHISLLYGLHDDCEDEDVMSGSTPEEYSVITLHNVSMFENEDYDVLKFDAKGSWMKECNDKLTKLPHTNDYPDYHPHATIGYLKSGTGKKYVDMLKGIEVKVDPKEIVYSKADGSTIKSPIKLEKAE